MKNLLFGCSYSDAWVSPSDWKTTTSKASLKKNWYVQCHFYDPLFAERYGRKGFQFRKSLNKYKTLEERRAMAELYLKEIPKLFEQEHFNPITKKFMVPPPEPEMVRGILHPKMPCAEAIEAAWLKISAAAQNQPKRKKEDKREPFADVGQAQRRFVKALRELRIDETPIIDLKLSHCKETLEYLKLPDASYNKFLAYMSKIFQELIEYSCAEINPFIMFKKKKRVQKIREVLTDEEFTEVFDYLHKEHYGFYRYGLIFHQSGARSTEMMMLQKKDVNIDKQEYRILIKKGMQYTEEIKVIMPDVLPFWKEVISECKSQNDFLFSEYLRPGLKPIAARQITRKWHKLIKTRFNEGRKKKITADFYPLKHLFLDKLDELQHNSATVHDTSMAQTLASHRSPNITNAVYLQNKKKRDREALKSVSVYKHE